MARKSQKVNAAKREQAAAKDRMLKNVPKAFGAKKRKRYA